MKLIKEIYKQNDTFKSLERAVKNGRTLYVSGLPSINKAALIYSLCSVKNKSALCIASDEKEAVQLCSDLSVMGMRAYVYPSRDYNFLNIESKSREYEHERLKVLLKLIENECDVVIACVDAAAQLTVPSSVLSDATLVIKQGEEIPLEKAVRALSLLGYERFDAVEGSGQFSVRGGILDFFMPDSEYPVRAEFWGDEVSELRYFDVETQRKIKPVSEVRLSPSAEILVSDKSLLADKIERRAGLLRGKTAAAASETLYDEAQRIRSGCSISNIDKFIDIIYEKPESLFDYIGRDFLLFASEFSNISDRGKAEDFKNAETLKQLFKDGVLCRGLDKFSLTFAECLQFMQDHGTVVLENLVHGSIPLRLSDTFAFTARQTPVWGGSYSQLKEDISTIPAGKNKIVILAGTPKAAKNLCENLVSDGFNAEYSQSSAAEAKPGRILVLPGTLSAGFELLSEKFSLFTYGAVIGAAPKKRRRIKNGQEICSLSELSVGDYVVHNVHGIGIFGGVRKINAQGVVKDYIKISYAKGDVLYVPVTQLDMVAKYIGNSEKSNVRLSKLGSQDWQKQKARVKSSVKDIAKQLIALYSARMKAKGYAFSGDNEWQHDFESHFEYEETPDQLRCCDEIKHDMERSVPMDRLLCGDVGFGKTEVALRAAFKCVADSKQCALLCPTTILAWQHYQTVTRRFESFPVRVELLSRFRTPTEQKEILARLKKGEIDIIVGTHRLVQKDVCFHDLGLAIVDEEQRFGVAQKERFKEMCKNVDVLTLSATPIPRTLNMAMTGLRDMSVIEEAPLNRQPVQTYVLEHDNAVINEAIRRELRRGGQVFYLHNDVESISSAAAAIHDAVPQAKIAVAHGKMKENELSSVWQSMLEQEVDVLVCTTIIETGVDLPNANTLIIENADRMGLSQLHQLRGRVGRSSRRAYAYFTFRRGKVLSEIQQKRLAAIREFTEFGSGFRIAMRDLELRGAGNVLGAQQHGHMDSVGYDMYLKLLEQAINEEKGAEPTAELECLVDISIDAHIPESYIQSLTLRLDAYRRIADIRTSDDCEDVKEELCDRFGKLPAAVTGLIDVALIRNVANKNGVYEIRQNGNKLMLFVRDIKLPFVANTLIAFNGKTMFTPQPKPFITFICNSGEAPIEALKRIFPN